jgi:hypothetical protein
VTATAVLTAAALLGAVGLSACGSSTAGAATYLRAARAAVLQLPDGSQRPAAVGMQVPKGATVRTALGGSAALDTAGRTLLIGQLSALTVVDGEREQLRAGLAMIDARRAPGLTLDAGAAVVRAPRGSLTRVERGALLRVGSFRKTVSVRAAARRAATPVPALHQVQVPDGALPGDVTPLALTGDSWERRYALDLVTADRDLTALAAGLDASGTGARVVTALPAAYTTAYPPALPEPRSEVALAYVVARAAHTRGSGPERFAAVRGLREEGGSWGVVAALVGADVAAVSAALDALLTAPGGGPLLAAGPDGAVSPGDLLGGGGPSEPPSGSGPAPRSSSPSATATPTPKPSPSPSDPVQTVVDTVSKLLPTPAPTPLLGLPVSPSPSPTPLLGVTLPGVGLSVG